MSKSLSRVLLAAAAALAAHVTSAASEAAGLAGGLEDWNREARAKFAAQRFGIFVHWGLYSTYAQGEWYLQGSRIAEADYARAKDGFYPSKFDARAWVALFKEAGAKYLTVTTRHHDGFSLWPTKVDDGYNVANTPFRRDVIGELAAACADAGLQINFYYSLMDWHRKDYPAGRASKSVLGDQAGDYGSYLKFMTAQIGELIDRYRPGNVWLDGEWDHTLFDAKKGVWTRTLDWRFNELYDFIHARRTLVANNNHQEIREKEDIQCFERDLPGDHSDLGFSKQQPVTNDRPVEQCDVLQNKCWGWTIGERKFRTAEEVVAMVARCAARGANMLMNVGPDGSGAIPPPCVETLKGVGRWFARNGESIYGTEAVGIGLAKEIVTTRKGDVLYVHFLDPKARRFAFRYEGEIRSARCLATGAPVSVERTPSGVAVLTIDREAGDAFDYVVEVRGEPEPEPTATGLSWCVFGTSISWYDAHPSEYGEPKFTHGYQSRVKRRLSFTGYHNLAINGGTVGGHRWAKVPRADLYTIEHGINDWGHCVPVGTLETYRAGADDGTFAANFRILIDKIRKANPRAVIVLCTPRRGFGFGTYLPASSSAPHGGIYLEEYAKLVRAIAADEGFEVADFFSDCGTDEELPSLSIDVALHPNDAGFQRMADCLEKAIRRATIERREEALK